MDEKRIAEIVLKVFEKAKEEHASHSRFALSNHISEHSDLSSKTLERAYDRYINNKKKFGPPNADSVDLLCKYLSFEDYADYINQGIPPSYTRDIGEPKPLAIKRIVPFLMPLVGILAIVGIVYIWSVKRENIQSHQNCMTWADSLYLPVSCDTGPQSKYGTPVLPLDPVKLNSFKKVKVTMATQFFSDQTNQPLIWYTKNKDGEIEYFTAPGLHPTTGKTLDEITEYIIEKYVPPHINRPESFLMDN